MYYRDTHTRPLERLTSKYGIYQTIPSLNLQYTRFNDRRTAAARSTMTHAPAL